MRFQSLVLILAVFIFSHSALAKEGDDAEMYRTRIRSVFYSGELTDPQPPTKADQKLWMQLEGRAAKAVFNKLKPTSQETVDVNGYNAMEKRREGLLCRSAARVQDYRCTFQIDLVSGTVFSGPIASTTTAEPWNDFLRNDFGSYKLFSFGIGDPQPPVFAKSYVGIYLRGATAQSLFKAIGPDVHDDCSSESFPYRLRVRAGGGLQCLYEINSKNYRCAIGLDLRKIKPDSVLIC